MKHFPATKFVRFDDVNDARVVLAAELSRFGAPRSLVMYFDEATNSGLVDVFVSDDDQKHVIIKMSAADNAPAWLWVAPSGCIKVESPESLVMH